MQAKIQQCKTELIITDSELIARESPEEIVKFADSRAKQ